MSGRAPGPAAARATARRARDAQAGERALGDGRYAEAQRRTSGCGSSARVAEVHARLGLIYFQQGKFAEAVPALRRPFG